MRHRLTAGVTTAESTSQDMIGRTFRRFGFEGGGDGPVGVLVRGTGARDFDGVLSRSSRGAPVGDGMT